MYSFHHLVFLSLNVQRKNASHLLSLQAVSYARDVACNTNLTAKKQPFFIVYKVILHSIAQSVNYCCGHSPPTASPRTLFTVVDIHLPQHHHTFCSVTAAFTFISHSITTRSVQSMLCSLISHSITTRSVHSLLLSLSSHAASAHTVNHCCGRLPHTASPRLLFSHCCGDTYRPLLVGLYYLLLPSLLFAVGRI